MSTDIDASLNWIHLPREVQVRPGHAGLGSSKPNRPFLYKPSRLSFPLSPSGNPNPKTIAPGVGGAHPPFNSSSYPDRVEGDGRVRSYTLHYVLLHRIYTLSLWFCSEEAEKTAPALGEPMDLMTALQLVMKKSLAHDGLVRGLHEAAKAIEKHAAQLCILAEDCNQSDYVKLVKALCADHNVHLVTVPSAKTLGEWAGVSIFSCLLSFKTFNLGCVFLHIKIPLKILFSCRTSILMYG
ncbi:hypothetical protein GW17_00045515 [Ensete ventricosum]|nr:hypothetical protein GW17_00045515 [Ensete ventricosum]